MRGFRERERVVSMLVWIAVALAAGASNAEEPQGRLVSAQWLSENLARQDVLILDARSAEAYGEDHIPGAVRLSVEELRRKDPPAGLLAAGELASALGKAGVAPGTTVIAYADEGSAGAETYLIYALDSLAHGLAAALDGGFAKWRAEGREVSTPEKEAAPRRYDIPEKAVEDFQVGPAEIEAGMQKGEIAVLAVEADGALPQTTGGSQGSIARAIRRRTSEDLLADGSWKDAKGLGQEYRALGVDGGKPIVVAGRDGIAASRVWFALRHVVAFENVKLYEGALPEGAGNEKAPSRSAADGARIIASRCSRCHSAGVPLGKKGQKSAAWWERTIGQMIANGAQVSGEEKAAIVEYLSAGK